MKQITRKEIIIFIIYSLIMLGLYISFLVIDWNAVNIIKASRWLKYSSIIVTSIYTLYLFIDSIFINKDLYIRLFALIAVLFTLLSDTFLILFDVFILYLVGLITFSLAQIATGIRIHLTNKNKPLLLVSISIRVLGLLAMLIVPFTFLKDYNLDISFFYSLAGFYFLNLLTNFIISFVSSIQIRKLYIILLTLGLLLFICCDIFVGLANIHLNPTFNKIAWIFYLPCQYLIAISIKREK